MPGFGDEYVDEYAVVVIGGGPAGPSSAALLSRQGHRVLLVERERHPGRP